jgi:hypothetical protein
MRGKSLSAGSNDNGSGMGRRHCNENVVHHLPASDDLHPFSPKSRRHPSGFNEAGVITRFAFSNGLRKLSRSDLCRFVRQPVKSSMATTELMKNCGRNVFASNSSLWFGLRKKSIRSLVSGTASTSWRPSCGRSPLHRESWFRASQARDHNAEMPFRFRREPRSPQVPG